jgi:phage-related holin
MTKHYQRGGGVLTGTLSFIFALGAEMAECIMRNYFEEEPVMDITKKVAALRFKYHANMLDVCNVLNQIGILKDEKAELVMKNHTMQCFDCLGRLGYPIEKFLKQQEEES